MKRLLFIPLIFICSSLWAGDSCKEPVQLARMNPYIAGAGVAAVCSAFAATCSGTCLYAEDFEGTTDCGGTGDDTYCRYTYTLTGAPTFNNANTTSQCTTCATRDVSIARSGSDISAVYAFTGTNTAYAIAYINVTTQSSGGDGTAVTLFALRSSSGTNRAWVVSYNDSGTWKFRFGHTNNSNVTVNTLGPAITTGKWYKINIFWNRNRTVSGGVDFLVDGSSYTPADTTSRDSDVGQVMYAVQTSNATAEFDTIKVQSDAYPTCN